MSLHCMPAVLAFNRTSRLLLVILEVQLLSTTHIPPLIHITTSHIPGGGAPRGALSLLPPRVCRDRRQSAPKLHPPTPGPHGTARECANNAGGYAKVARPGQGSAVNAVEFEKAEVAHFKFQLDQSVNHLEDIFPKKRVVTNKTLGFPPNLRD